MTTLITVEDAKRQGLVRYFTGEPCKHGHVAERYVNGRQCVVCDREWNKASRQPNAPKAARVAREPVMASASKAYGFSEPQAWTWDGGKRREPVLDMDYNPPRVVRSVGWRCCMKCAKRFFSEDVIKVRMCDRCRPEQPPW